MLSSAVEKAQASASFATGIMPLSAGGLGALTGGQSDSMSVPMPFTTRIVLLEGAHIAGTTHIQYIDEIAEGLKVGQDLTLQRETGNRYDKWAILVFKGTTKLGYVTADRNEVLARLMDGGKKLGATITGKEQLGSWHKVLMEVYLED